MSHIHLIYPDINTGYYPNMNHGMAFLAGSLRSRGHKVSFDHITSLQPPDDVALRALSDNPDVVGFSLCHNQVTIAEQYVHAIRKKNEKTFLIAGGIFPTTDPESAFNKLELDAIAIGEAEYSLVNLMDNISGNKDNIYETRGFYFRAPDGEIIKNNVSPLETDLSKLSFPDYSIFDIDKIVKDSGGWTTMMLLRGCPYNCNYCCNSVLMNLYPVKKDYFRIPPVGHAIDLIKHNLSFVDNVKGISFDDDLLCQNKDWFMAFSDAYSREIGLAYTMNTRVEKLSDDIINAMKRSGCRTVNIGVESGNPWVRKNLLNRRYSNEQLIEAFAKLQSAGILTSAFNMMGLPFETKSQMLDTLKINKKLQPYRGTCFYFYPYPSTKLYDICKKFDLLNEDSEKMTGYFGSPAIKLTHCDPKSTKKICERLRLYLYLRRILNNIRLGSIASILYYLMIPFAGIVSKILVGDSKLKALIRSFVYRTVPSLQGNKEA